MAGRLLEFDELESIVEQIRDQVTRDIVRFAALTGWRKGEILALTWDMVNAKQAILVIPGSHTKNGEPKQFPLDGYPQLLELLAARRAETRLVERRTGRIVPHVFSRSDGEAVKSIDGAWRGAVSRSGVGPVRFHDLRVYALHAMEMAGLPRSLAMTLSGHKTESVYTRYSSIFTSRELRQAGQKLAQYHAERAAEGSAGVVPLRHNSGTIDPSDRMASTL